VLLSGDHPRVARWRREQSLLRTLRWRPDLLEVAPLTQGEREWLIREHGWSGADGGH
jgi:tRNA (guanine37-N1)-methyltransferase